MEIPALLAALAQPDGSELVSALRLDLIAKLSLAVLLGGAIGLERQIAGKPAGLRTNILICVGSALLMDLSINLASPLGRQGDPARLAAQVVTGVGFLGAGTILHGEGRVTGLTSAATIWVVMALGLTVGAGYYVEALGTGVLVTVVLTALGRLEHRLLRAKRFVSGTIRVAPGVPFDEIETAMRNVGVRVLSRDIFDHPNDRVFEVRLSGPASQFEIMRDTLLRRADILGVHFV